MVQFSQDRLKTEFETQAVVHLEYLYGLAKGLTRDSAFSEDLVQETYLRAYRNFDLFRRGTNCLAWLIRIMTNTFINHYHKTRRRPVHLELNHEIYSSESIPDGRMQDVHTVDDEKLLDYFVSDRVKKAINSLPADYRVMVIMADLRGLPYQDIALCLGCPLGTVRSRLSRGRSILKRKLDSIQN